MRILITGAAGYLGHQLAERLTAEHDVLGIDVRQRDDVTFPLRRLDIRDPGLADLMDREGITHVAHLASVLQASKDRSRDFDIDVNGTRNVLDACVRAGARHLTVTSSGAAYGYHADNPTLIDENDPLRGNPEFAYADHKRRVEELLASFRSSHPELAQLVLRMGTVLGEQTDNQITALFTGRAVLGLRGADSPFVFVWDADVLAVLAKGICEERQGVYNVAGDGTLRIDEIAALAGKPLLRLPVWLVRAGLRLQRWSGRPVGPEQVAFLRYRPVLANRRLKECFGYVPALTSAQALERFTRARSMLS